MPWTTPRTWVANELVTAAIMNTHVRDNLSMLNSLIGGALSPTPPGSPADGQLWSMAPGANGEVWTFRYNAGSASAYKWEFVGGAPLTHDITAAETCTTTSLGDLATVGPQVTLPRAGDYVLSFSVGAHYVNVASSVNAAQLAQNNVAHPAAFATVQGGTTTGVYLGSLARTVRINGFGAADVIKLRYSNSGGNATFAQRSLQAFPVRIQ